VGTLQDSPLANRLQSLPSGLDWLMKCYRTEKLPTWEGQGFALKGACDACEEVNGDKDQ
jgi:hypothetical protein